MDDPLPHIRLPSSLSDNTNIVVPILLNDDEFQTHEVEFIRATFGYASFLRSRGRKTPLSDAFIIVFVAMLEVLEANAPEEAEVCRSQLQLLLAHVFSRPDAV